MKNISDRYYCWLVVYEKLPFDECDFEEDLIMKLDRGYIKDFYKFEDHEKIVAVVVGGTRRTFRDFQRIRLIEVSDYIASLLIDIMQP